MGTNTTKDDAKAMRGEYVKGANISFLADKYGHPESEVYDAVVNSDDSAPVAEEAVPAEEKKSK